MIFLAFFTKIKAYILFIILIFPLFTSNIQQLIGILVPFHQIITILSLISFLFWIKSCKYLFNKVFSIKNNTFFIINYYYLVFLYFIGLLIIIIVGRISYQPESIFLSLLIGIIGLYTFFSHLYLFHIIAKTLTDVYIGNSKNWHSLYIYNILKILFIPIGIWFIQPKINKLYEENKDKFK